MASVLAFFEEVGWRAWMLPRLLEQMSTRRAVVASSLIWTFWHTPYALSGIHHLPGIPIALVAVTLPLVNIGAGLIIGWLWLQTESIWIATLAHGALNNWGQYAFKLMGDGGPGSEPRDMLVLAAGGVALIGVGTLLLRLRPVGKG
jgi:membrane protease YdiL (CAAX protease family)